MNDMLEAGMADHGGNAVLRAYFLNGDVRIFKQLNQFDFLKHVPLVYHTFQYGSKSQPQGELHQVASEDAVKILIGYARTGVYPVDALTAPEPLLLLPHVHAYHLARNLDVKDLKDHARGALSITTSRAISFSEPPVDLVETVRFVYQYIADAQRHEQHNLVSTLANYCFAALFTQGLDRNEDFIQALKDTPLFLQDLCKVNFERGFSEDCAQVIISLAHDAPPICSEPNPTTLASRDLPDEMYLDEDEADLMKQEDAEEIEDIASADEAISLADSTATIRPGVKGEDSDSDMDSKDAEKTAVAYGDTDTEDDNTAVAYVSESEDGFFMVRHPTPKPDDSTFSNIPMPSADMVLPHRPKTTQHNSTLGEAMSPPEVIAMPDNSNISDDEDYTML